MPKYRVELSDGRVFLVEAAAPPSEADVQAYMAQAGPGRVVPRTLERTPPVPTAPPSARPEGTGNAQWFGRNFAERALPSTTPSDYVKGPLYALRHPLESAQLLGEAIWNAHADQAHKTTEAAGRVFTAPTIGGKMGAVSEALGHGVATVLPFVGPAAAQVGEQLGEGDVVGAAGGAAGLLTPMVVRPGVQAAARVTRPVRTAVANRVRQGATRQMEQALAPTTNANKVRAARVAPEMVNRRVWARNLEKLEERAATASERAGQDVGAEIARVANRETDVLPLVDELEQAKTPHVDTNGAGQRVVIDPAPVKSIQRLQDVLMEYGDRISIGSLNKVRQQWDEVVKAGKGFTTHDLGTHWKTWAAREGRSVLRDELGRQSPDIDRVMAEYSFWQNVEDVAAATNKRRVGQSGSLTPTIAGGAGAIVAESLMPGAATATKVGGAVLGAKLAAELRRLLSSPGYQMWSAVQKGRLADALASGNQARIATIVARGLTATASAEPTRAFPVGRQSDTPREERPQLAPVGAVAQR